VELIIIFGHAKWTNIRNYHRKVRATLAQQIAAKRYTNRVFLCIIIQTITAGFVVITNKKRSLHL